MSVFSENSTLGNSMPATAPQPAPPGAAATPQPGATGSVLPRIRTLIVDDQAISREALRRLLGQEPDVEIVGTFDGPRQALEAVRQLQPDLLFVDVQMPEMTGLELVGRLQDEHRIAVVFVTANPEFAAKAFDLGAIDYLLKPCTRERLQKALERVRGHLKR
jgi:two-component system LytT family response regulator